MLFKLKNKKKKEFPLLMTGTDGGADNKEKIPKNASGQSILTASLNQQGIQVSSAPR